MPESAGVLTRSDPSALRTGTTGPVDTSSARSGSDPRDTESPPSFRTLTAHLRAAGLLERRRRYYARTIALWLGALVAAWALVVLLRTSWWVLGAAILLGVISTQLGFLGHDAGHRQICRSSFGNRLIGLLIGDGLIGLSFDWWVPKHQAHHAYPNEPGRDPDIGPGPAGPSTVPDGGDRSGRLAWWMECHQAGLFVPLILLRSTGLYVSGAMDVYRRRDRRAALEALFLGVRAAAYLTAVFLLLPLPVAIAFLVVYEATFSVYLGCSFAPNHKGMPLVTDGRGLGFARRQVSTSRNLTGGRWTTFVFGGLNYQIEHHLFPMMPRPNLARAQSLVREFCSQNDLGYRESTTTGSCLEILAHLRIAGRLAAARGR